MNARLALSFGNRPAESLMHLSPVVTLSYKDRVDLLNDVYRVYTQSHAALRSRNWYTGMVLAVPNVIIQLPSYRPAVD